MTGSLKLNAVLLLNDDFDWFKYVLEVSQDPHNPTLHTGQADST